MSEQRTYGRVKTPWGDLDITDLRLDSNGYVEMRGRMCGLTVGPRYSELQHTVDALTRRIAAHHDHLEPGVACEVCSASRKVEWAAIMTEQTP